MKYHIITFGCQMNEADSSLMAALLEAAGWEACARRDEADLVVVNTCSVREKPEHKVDSLLGELRKGRDEHAGRLVAVTGCMAQREGEELARRGRGVDIVLGTRSFHHLAEAVERARGGERPVVMLGMEEDPSPARCAMTPGKSVLKAFVPIILGCTNFCSYCIVPYVRGGEKSRPAEEIRGEVESLVSRGAREVTLLGQNVLAYGRDLDSGGAFADLLGDLSEVEGLWRIRYTTCHPRDVRRELIEVMRDQPQVCEHIHLPIQAGTDKLLGEMNRGYTVEQYRRVVDELRAGVPGMAITTDMMVGFPGETADDFESSLRLYETIRFDAAFMFAYSPRPGTKAAQREDQVPRNVRLERLHRLIEVQNRITVERNREEIGNVVEVLVEGPAEKGEGLLVGRGSNNKLVVFRGSGELAGRLGSVRLTEAHLWGFRGEALQA